MNPYYQDNHIRIFNKDCRDMAELPDESVQCVVTSPPYWGLRKYSGEQELIWGGDNHCKHQWGQKYIGDTRAYGAGIGQWQDGSAEGGRPYYKVSQGKLCSLCGTWKGAYGLEPTPEMYVEHTVEILREIRRVLRKDGVVFWNIGDSYQGGNRGASAESDMRRGDQGGSFQPHNIGAKGIVSPSRLSHPTIKPKDLCLIPFRVAIAAQEDGWWVRSVIIWSKPNPMPESVTDRPTESHEYILMLTKAARYYWDMEAVRERGLTDSARATSRASLGSSALAPELGSTLLADDATPNLRGRCYLSESQITIIGSVARNTCNLKVLKAISLTIIGEQTERQFVMDLQPSSDTASLALITSTLKSLSANNTPVRATIVNATTSPSGAIDANLMLTIPSTDTSPTTEAVTQALSMLTSIVDEGLPTLVTLYSEELESPLLIRGTLRSSHIDHNTINTNRNQVKQRGLKTKGLVELGGQEQHHGQDIIDDSTGRNLKSVWTFPTQPYPEAHFAVFPEKLPELCIKVATPEVGCCSKCGAPWKRRTKLTDEYKTLVARPLKDEAILDGLGEYLKGCRQRLNLSKKDIAKHFLSETGGITGCVWNWENDNNIPTLEQYAKLKGLLTLDNRFDEDMGKYHTEAEGAWKSASPAYGVKRQTSDHISQVPERTETLGWQPTCKCNAARVPSLVLDPFMGAGTTLWVAKKLNRYAAGYELSQEYCQLAVKRCRQQVLL